MENIKIEKNVAMPTDRPKGYHPRWPIKNMDVGDSIYVAGYSTGEAAFRSAYKHGKRFGKKYRRRKEGDGLRIWRVE